MGNILIGLANATNQVMPQADGACLDVGVVRIELRRATAKDLRVRLQLDVNFQPDDRRIFHDFRFIQ